MAGGGDQMVHRFAGGVRDAAGMRAYLEMLPGEVVAVDLSNGAVLWRRDRIGRPVGATPTRLLTLAQNGNSFVLLLTDAATGADAGRIENFGMPDWAARAGTAADAVQVETKETPTGIQLTWRLRQPYRGGGPPPRNIVRRASALYLSIPTLDGSFQSATSYLQPPERLRDQQK
jgi:hypothetical protein